MKDKQDGKSSDANPVAAGKKPKSKPGTSGAPGAGGSRQGNIGHQSDGPSDNRHR